MPGRGSPGKRVPFGERWRKLRSTLREVRRSALYTLFAIPVAAVGLASLHSPAPIEETPYLRDVTKVVKNVREAQSWDAAKGFLKSGYKPFTLEDYLSGFNNPALKKDDVFTFYFYHKPTDEIRFAQINRGKAKDVVNDLLSAEQREEITDVFLQAVQKIAPEVFWHDDPRYERKFVTWSNLAVAQKFAPGSKFVESKVPMSRWGWINTPEGKTLDYETVVAQLILSGEFESVLGGNKNASGEIREALSKIPPEKLDAAVAKYAELTGSVNRTARPLAALGLLLIAAGNLSLAAKSYLREKRGGIDLDSALARLKQQGKTPSPAEVLREAGVPSVYAKIIGASRRGEAWDVQKWFADNAVQSGLQESTRRERRRAHPIKPEALVSYLADCMLNRKRPLLYGFWGGHKESESGIADSFDKQAMGNLKSMVDSMTQGGLKRPEVKLIFADAHSRDFNGIPQEEIDRYYRSVHSLARQHGFKVVRLSRLYKTRSWGKYSAQVTRDSKPLADAVLADGESMDVLLKSAAKHSKLVESGAKTPEAVVGAYVRNRIVEGRMLPLLFNGIHWSYSDPRIPELLPDHPTLFIHSLKRGDSRVPWFVEGAPLRR